MEGAVGTVCVVNGIKAEFQESVSVARVERYVGRDVVVPVIVWNMSECMVRYVAFWYVFNQCRFVSRQL